MFLHHFRFAWRNLVKDRRFAILNLTGLATGLACALLIWLWISDEMGMDKFNEKDDRLYQVMQNMELSHGIETMEYTAGLLANGLAEEMPEVEYAATVIPASWFSSPGIMSVGESKLKVKGQFISKDYFNIFSYRFLAGDKHQFQADKNAIAISDELAMKLFHTTDVVGKMIEWAQSEFNGPYIIKGVFVKNAANVSDNFDALFNFDQFIARRPGMEKWTNSDPNTYVLLKEGVDVDRFNARIHDFMLSRDKGDKKTLFVRKFSDKYLYG
ncbi:MAG: ABC transporter permease, partial [Niastella sp.]|nr:ABC transporter permease [Niastella sp.]